MIKIMIIRGGVLAITNRLRFKFGIGMLIKKLIIVFGLSRGSSDWNSFSVEMVYNLSAKTNSL